MTAAERMAKKERDAETARLRMARMRARRDADLVTVEIGKHPPIAVPRDKADEAYRKLLKVARDAE